jgi:hypothetical protein
MQEQGYFGPCPACNCFNGCFAWDCHFWHDIHNPFTHLGLCDLRSYDPLQGNHFEPSSNVYNLQT